MLGGGTFIAQNKVLPGSYINFVSAASASTNLGERGYAALALPLTWGKDGAIFTVTGDDFRKNCLKIFGFQYTSEEAKGLRDLFKNLDTLYCYKLMNGGTQASNAVAQALCKGSKGLKISTEILEGTQSGTFDVNIYFENSLVFSETVTTLEELKADDNGWVTWTLETLESSSRNALSGTDLDGEEITAAEHSAFLDAAQAYSFNAMGCLSSDGAIQDLYVQEVKDMRDKSGVKYQLVVCGKAADYEGVVNIRNTVDAVYWVTGIIASCAVNASNTNKVYDGEYDIPASFSKAELEEAIGNGEFILHRVGEEIRVLEDINSLKTTTTEKGDDFKSNQTIRVIDQIAMDIAKLFANKYLGRIPNDDAGRVSLWNDIVNHHQDLQQMRAIEDFSPSDITVEQGDTKKSVVVSDMVSVVNAMSQLYMSVVVQ